MDSWSLQNLIAKGMGVAARKLGRPFNVYRPDGPQQPLAPQNRVIKLFAAFQAEGGTGRAPDYGEALWQGTFDAAYTRVGDYLVGETETYFVAAQKPALPVQCVLTNRVATVVRPGETSQRDQSEIQIATLTTQVGSLQKANKELTGSRSSAFDDAFRWQMVAIVAIALIPVSVFVAHLFGI